MFVESTPKTAKMCHGNVDTVLKSDVATGSYSYVDKTCSILFQFVDDHIRYFWGAVLNDVTLML